SLLFSDSTLFRSVIADFAVHAGIYDEPRRHDDDRVAVRRRAPPDLDAEIAAGAGHILDIELLTPGLGQSLRHHACDHVGRTAGGERHDHADFAIGIIIGSAARRHERQSDREAYREACHETCAKNAKTSPGGVHAHTILLLTLLTSLLAGSARILKRNDF